MSLRHRSRKPPIVIGEIDHYEMVVLAMGGLASSSSGADYLLSELERARVLPEKRLPRDVVRIGSRVTCRTEIGDVREALLVYPVNADPEAGRVSVLTALGAALIGLRPRQSMRWLDHDGASRVLTVLAVEQEHGEP